MSLESFHRVPQLLGSVTTGRYNKEIKEEKLFWALILTSILFGGSECFLPFPKLFPQSFFCFSTSFFPQDGEEAAEGQRCRGLPLFRSHLAVWDMSLLSFPHLFCFGSPGQSFLLYKGRLGFLWQLGCSITLKVYSGLEV